ncbi:MAG TPA: PIN domain-containing protein [Gemmataceae bacterium]|jgi:predicted nucleic acid-binding protein|nr:PIN domain-containing protein [Gemmataceae bacterium]
MRIYVDTELISHVLLANVPISGRVTSRIYVPGVTTVVSDLTRFQCLSAARRAHNAQLEADYNLFWAPGEVVTLMTAVFDLAIQIRVQHGFLELESIHLAAAAHYQCDEFLTRKRRLKQYPGVRVQVI